MFLANVLDQTMRKLKSQVANIITLVNLGFGGMAIIASLNEQLNLSLIFIFLAALCDRLDGMTARKFQIESELGKQLDSMSDIISFGVAPALLLYQGIFHGFGFPGIFFTIFYIGCGAFRLARFNITENSGYFTGLPITMAGCFLTISYFAIPYVPASLFLYYSLLLSLLMVSPFSIKKI